MEIPDAVPFESDREHASYDADAVERFWQLLTTTGRVLNEFRTSFVGKSSPVHLFWGALDLATTRFSGRAAPPHTAGAPNCGPHVMLEAYSQEVSSAGYWPGGAAEGVFYSYAYPEPAGYRDAPVVPAEARYDDDARRVRAPVRGRADRRRSRAASCSASSTARTPPPPTPAAGTAPRSSVRSRRGRTMGSRNRVGGGPAPDAGPRSLPHPGDPG